MDKAILFLCFIFPLVNCGVVKRQIPFNPFNQFPQQGGGFNPYQQPGFPGQPQQQQVFNPFAFPGAFQPGPINGQQQPQQQFNQQQPQQQFNQQQPQQQFNQQQQTQQPTTPSTTSSPQVRACSEQCLNSTPSTYNPVCGSDGTTYHNRQRFDCIVECGRQLTITRVGACPSRNATTNRPT